MPNADRLVELQKLVEIVGPTWAEGYLRVHRTTLKRWLDGKTRVPESALVTLRAAAWGQMPGRKAERCWDGWYFADGRLWSPEDTSFEASELRAIPYLRGELRALRAHVAKLQATLAAERHAGDVRCPAANDSNGASALVQDQIAAPWP